MAISQALHQAMNDQIKHELASAYLYLSMAAAFEAQNLPGFAHWMRIQAQEEAGHAMKFFDHLSNRGARVTLQAIDAPPADFPTPLDAFQRALDHERWVTSLIGQLYNTAVEQGDLASLPLLQWFLEEQIEEERTAEQLVETLKRIDGNWTGIILLDRQLAGRKPEE